MSKPKNVVLGAGVTGLIVGLISGLPIYEAEEIPGGICCSYYVGRECLRRAHGSVDADTYRFEIGGGHWIWGSDLFVGRLINCITTVKSYVRKCSVYLPAQDLLVPYPIQNHLRYLGSKKATQILREMIEASSSKQSVATMDEWLRANFGFTLCELFFDPFHKLYTAGLSKSIAPQDAHKSPVNVSLAIQGALDEAPAVGYNVSFVYPEEGLDTFAGRMAAKCEVHYNKRAVHIDIGDNVVYFQDGSAIHYEALLSTLPLNRMMEMTGLTLQEKQDPYSSLLVINVGAAKAQRCPNDHWVYIPRSKADFHRVGFYSNVDASFLPASARDRHDRVSIYVEKAYPQGQKPNHGEIKALCSDVVRELQEWKWIGNVEVMDPTWIDVAYTWSFPRSTWVEQASRLLADCNIYQVGRFASWSVSKGIADSVREGALAGAAFNVS